MVYYSDKAGCSIPAPGRGALTVVKEVPSNIIYLFSASRITLANLPSGGTKSPSG